MTISNPPSFLSGLSATDRKSVVQAASRKEFPAGHVLINTGAPANNVYLVTKGRVKYYRVTSAGDEVLLWRMESGDVFGIGSMLRTQARYIGTAETVSKCELLVWSRKKMRSLAAQHEVLFENALNFALYYLTSYADRVVGLIAETAEERLAHTLIRLARQTGRVRPGGVELQITNEELGGLANISIFTASRQLQQWERAGVIKKGRGKVRILSPEGLLPD
jgi:CRP-like cAMP-binding protein